MVSKQTSITYFEHDSERLHFRKLTEEDIVYWEHFLDDPEPLKFYHFEFNGPLETFPAQWVHQQMERYQTQGLGQLAVLEKDSGAFIGVAGIIPRKLFGKTEYEITCALLPEHRRKGYGSELDKHFLQLGRELGISDRYIMINHRDNLPAIRKSLKLDAELIHEGVMHDRPVKIFAISA